MTKTITIHDELSIKWINQKAKQLNVNLEDLIIKLILQAIDKFNQVDESIWQ